MPLKQIILFLSLLFNNKKSVLGRFTNSLCPSKHSFGIKKAPVRISKDTQWKISNEKA